MAGDRGKMSSFPDPLELEHLEGGEQDPSVFDRITTVPGEVAERPPGAPAADDQISGLHPRAPSEHPASFRDPLADDALPPVLGRLPASSRRGTGSTPTPALPEAPKAAKPEESWKNTGARRTLDAKRPVLELELDDLDAHEQAPAKRPDALEVSLPEQRRAEPTLPSREPAPSRPTTPEQMRAASTVPARAPERARETAPVAQVADESWLDARSPSARPQVSPEVLDMRDRYATGDFTGALVVAQAVLELTPDHEEARRCLDRCTDVLSQMYLARLGSPAQAVRVAVPTDQIRWLSLDHRAGFLLSLIDGHSTIEELLDISGMPRLDALRILHGLLDQRVIALADRP